MSFFRDDNTGDLRRGRVALVAIPVAVLLLLLLRMGFTWGLLYVEKTRLRRTLPSVMADTPSKGISMGQRLGDIITITDMASFRMKRPFTRPTLKNFLDSSKQDKLTFRMKGMWEQNWNRSKRLAYPLGF